MENTGSENKNTIMEADKSKHPGERCQSVDEESKSSLLESDSNQTTISTGEATDAEEIVESEEKQSDDEHNPKVPTPDIENQENELDGKIYFF